MSLFSKARGCFVLGVVVLGVTSLSPAMAGSVTVKNCFSGDVWFGSFNSNDAIAMIPYSDGCLSTGDVRTLKCATSKCAIRRNHFTCSPGTLDLTKPLSGSFIYYNGTLVSGTECPK